ncbi:hypothetical protein EPI10_002556 [Gossypium australe]|uniref:Uncharacterized protein n=1 Tax=Gossypium australe TaxID=47621 RepID=A0A5B6VEL6_9ROSI|nr:hypothetical protein EPI10_002556 [Gossypium australe]
MGHSFENCIAFKKLIERFIKMGIVRRGTNHSRFRGDAQKSEELVCQWLEMRRCLRLRERINGESQQGQPPSGDYFTTEKQ